MDAHSIQPPPSESILVSWGFERCLYCCLRTILLRMAAASCAKRVILIGPLGTVLTVINARQVLYSEADLGACLAKCEVVDTHQAMEHKGVRFKA